MSADSFFEIGYRLGFISGMDVFIFDDMAGEDSNGDSTTPIVTKLSTGRVTFGDFDCKKRLCKFSLLTAPQNFFEVSVTDAEGESQIYSVSDNSGEELGYIEKRTSSRRSRYYSLTVTGRSKAPVSICGMTLTAAK